MKWLPLWLFPTLAWTSVFATHGNRFGRALLRARRVNGFGNIGNIDLPLKRTAAGWYTVDLRLAGNSSRVIVDTASPWLWAYGSAPMALDNAPSPPRFMINYLSARLGGAVVNETLSLTTNSETSGERPAHCLAGRASEGDQFWLQQLGTSGIQGVLGLACGTADSGNADQAALQPSLYCAATAAGIADGLSTFTLQLNAEGGTLTFGQIPDSLLPGMVAMPSSLMCGNWRAPVTVKVGGEGNSKKFGGEVEAIIDSGAPGFVGPSEIMAKMSTALGAQIQVRNGKMIFLLPCSRQDVMPSVFFVLGTRAEQTQVEIPGAELLIKDQNSESGQGDAGTADQCRLHFSAWDSPQWILGMPFFRQVRGIAFDPYARKVSIAS